MEKAPRVACMRDEVGQLVEKRAGQFLREGEQARIKQDDRAVEPRESGGSAQARVPVQCDARGKLR